jgi:hypothetical protein
VFENDVQKTLGLEQHQIFCMLLNGFDMKMSKPFKSTQKSFKLMPFQPRCTFAKAHAPPFQTQ